jgi:Leucine-rich repeat (LRR) protein
MGNTVASHDDDADAAQSKATIQLIKDRIDALRNGDSGDSFELNLSGSNLTDSLASQALESVLLESRKKSKKAKSSTHGDVAKRRVERLDSLALADNRLSQVGVNDVLALVVESLRWQRAAGQTKRDNDNDDSRDEKLSKVQNHDDDEKNCWIHSLVLDDNAMQSFDVGTEALETLVELSVQRNGLSAFKSAASMSLVRLERLNLGGNALTHLSSALVKCWRRMRSVSLDDNRIELLPRAFCENEALFGSLVELSVSSNGLRALPTGIGRLGALETLVASDNALRRLPRSLGACARLRVLRVDGNHLTDVPDSLAELEALDELDLTRNNRTLLLAALLGRGSDDSGDDDDDADDDGDKVLRDAAAMRAALDARWRRRADSAARLVQSHWRASTMRRRFRNVVRLALATSQQRQMLSSFLQSSVKRRSAALVIQRAWRSRAIRMRWCRLIECAVSGDAHALTRSLVNACGGDEQQQRNDAVGNSAAASSSASDAYVASAALFDGSMRSLVFCAEEKDTRGKPLLHGAVDAELVEFIVCGDWTEAHLLDDFLLTRPHVVPSLHRFATWLREILAQRGQGAADSDDDKNEPLQRAQLVRRLQLVLKRLVQSYSMTLVDANADEVNELFELMRSVDLQLTDDLVMRATDPLTSQLTGGIDVGRFLAALSEAPPVKLPSNAKMSALPSDLDERLEFMCAHVQPEEVARQMTIIESTMARMIAPQEMTGQAWNKRREIAPNMLAMIERFNQVAQWIAYQVVQVHQLKARAKRLAYFLSVAEHCLAMNNFHSALQIGTGLSNSAVSRLKLTWGVLSGSVRPAWQRIEALLDPSGNYRNYRNACRLVPAGAPCVPFLGVLSSDLTFADDGNPDTIESGGNGDEHKTRVTNYSKCRVLASIMRPFYEHIGQIYMLQPCTWIQEILLGGEFVDDKELYELSLVIEPRSAAGSSSAQSSPKPLHHSIGSALMRSFKAPSSALASSAAAVLTPASEPTAAASSSESSPAAAAASSSSSSGSAVSPAARAASGHKGSARQHRHRPSRTRRMTVGTGGPSPLLLAATGNATGSATDIAMRLSGSSQAEPARTGNKSKLKKRSRRAKSSTLDPTAFAAARAEHEGLSLLASAPDVAGASSSRASSGTKPVRTSSRSRSRSSSVANFFATGSGIGSSTDRSHRRRKKKKHERRHHEA